VKALLPHIDLFRPGLVSTSKDSTSSKCVWRPLAVQGLGAQETPRNPSLILTSP